MNMKLMMATGVLMMLPLHQVHAQRSVTTKRGGTATSSVSQTRNTVTASGSAVSARGKSVSGTASATKTINGATANATVHGPKGGTTTATGSAVSNGNGTDTVSGAVTGPQGATHSASKTVTPK